MKSAQIKIKKRFEPAAEQLGPDLIHWLAPEEAAALQGNSKPLLYEFTAAWCPPCRRMDKQVFHSKVEADFINATYVPVRVMDRQREDGRNSNEAAALHRKFKVEAFPTLVISAGALEPKILVGFPGDSETTDFIHQRNP
jgi:thiol:disulfide interchange protein